MRTLFASLPPWPRAFGAAIILSGVLAAGPGAAQPFSPDILESVVSVLPEWPGFGGGPDTRDGRPKNPEGSAVAILAGGYLATNVHVIGKAKKIKIRLGDGRLLAATIIGRDARTDIALIKAPIDFPVPAFGPDPGLGGRVCAIGNQFGLGLSVTCGVVSALHRTGTGFNPIEDFIQTDAVVNPGGSGGALVDGDGRLVGLVSAIFTKDSDANIGVNFASSLNLVLRVVGDLKKHGRVIYGRSGVVVRALDERERATLFGARVVRIIPNGAGAEAGLQPGDLIVAIDERKILKVSDIPSAIHMNRPGQSLTVEFIRDGKRQTATLVLAE